MDASNSQRTQPYVESDFHDGRKLADLIQTMLDSPHMNAPYHLMRLSQRECEFLRDSLRSFGDTRYGPADHEALREAIGQAAYEWQQYVIEDEAPRNLVEHMEAAFDAALKNAAPQLNRDQEPSLATTPVAARASSEAGADDGWIDVEKQRPEGEPKRYLVSDGEVWRTAWFHPVPDGHHFWDCHGSQIVVTHWKPLPSLPVATDRSAG